MKTYFIILLSLIFLCCAAVANVSAEDMEDYRDVRETVSQKNQGKKISLELNKSLLFRLERPAIRVSISATDVADVTLLTPRQILVVSKKIIGTTNLIVWYDEEEVESFDVEIFIPNRLLEIIESTIKEHAPRAYITLNITPTSIIIDGFVEDQETFLRVEKIVKSYVPNVTNLIKIRGTIQKAINRVTGGEHVKVIMEKSGLLLDGTVDSQATLIRVLQVARGYSKDVNNMMTVKSPQQVQLEVTIAEVSRSAIKQRGLSYLLNSDGGRLGLLKSGALSDTSDDSSGSYSIESEGVPDLNDVASALWGAQVSDVLSDSAVNSAYGSAFQILVQSMDDNWLSIISLLKGQGLARTLATPTLVALNGQKAKFLVGGEIPYVTEEAIIFREFGIQLEFTPYLTGKESMTLVVEPTVSSVDWSFDPPGLKERAGSTTLSLKDGQTFVMAGLITEEFSEISNKIPFLADIPVLGSLFESKQFRKSESELIIVVTPRLVRPLNRNELKKVPIFKQPKDINDEEFFLYKTNTDSNVTDRNSAPPQTVGTFGFAR